MADIDKTLPNIILNEPKSGSTDVDITEEIKEKGPVEVTEDEDGATIDFDPNAMPLPEEGDHFTNLNDLLPQEITDPIANRLEGDYREYKASRSDWERAYTVGLDLLGFKLSLIHI